jgi:uncharacterized repeat protein (TIGR01451 family)
MRCIDTRKTLCAAVTLRSGEDSKMATMKRDGGSLRLGTMTALATALCGVLAMPAQARVPGKDGAFTASAANTTINSYTTLTAGAGAGDSTINVGSAAGITAGDVLLIYQAQGATISTANASSYGTVSTLGNAGRYEYVSVASVSGNTITLGRACSLAPLRFSYSSSAQVLRVPQYSSLTVNAGASVVAQAWNGSTGGVVAAIVDGTATVNGSINADNLGFRGGAIDNVTTAAGTDVPAYVATTTADGAEKGEGIAGSQTIYDGLGGRYNRGAPANGGGGGNAHNAGGGGGGSVVLVAPGAGTLGLSATGGNGGNQLITNNESEGPGGGGGGGFVASPAGTGTNTGGANGTTSSGAVTEFVPNGATRGNTGNATAAPSLSNIPLCNVSNLADLSITKTNTPLAGPNDQAADTVASGTQTTYSVVVTNNGPGPAINAVISDTPGAGLTCPPANVVTCTSAAAGACPAGPLTVANLTAGITLGTLPATAGSNTATFSFNCTVQ